MAKATVTNGLFGALQGKQYLVGTSAAPVTKATLAAFIAKHGGPAMVTVVPLPNVQAGSAVPVPFGYNGKPGGVRQQLQNMLLQGVNGSRVYAAIVPGYKALRHPVGNDVCLLALLNGGYSPSHGAWGTPYAALVASGAPAAKPKAAKPKAAIAAPIAAGTSATAAGTSAQAAGTSATAAGTNSP